VLQPPLGQRRALFLSGMYGSEVVELIAAYREAGVCQVAAASAPFLFWHLDEAGQVDLGSNWMMTSGIFAEYCSSVPARGDS
jgi:hypothetical protein